MKLYSWNVNGLRACSQKEGWRQLVSRSPDVLCLQETKARPEQISEDLLDEYQVIWSSAAKAGYSGTAIATRLPILDHQLNFPDSIAQKYALADQYGDCNLEGRLVTVELADFYLVNVYTPNAKGDLGRLPMRFKAWDPAFKEYLEALKLKKPVLSCGDFNVAHQPIDLARPEQNKGKHGFTDEERSGFDNLLASDFIDTWREQNPDKTDSYTYWTMWGQARARNVGWRIDYWLADKRLKDRLGEAEIHGTILGSDHCPISLEIKWAFWSKKKLFTRN